MMKAESLIKQYGAVRSLDAVTVTIDDGSILGLIGSNGSGKSTFLRLLCGILKPDGGCVLYDGSNLWENTDAKAKLLYVSDEPFFLPHSSLIEMSALYESIYPSYSRERFAELAALFSLDTRRKINTFSRGMQKQAAILLALAVRPKCLLLDETFDGLDPVMRQMVKRRTMPRTNMWL